jgi:hypothetical protein
VTEPRDEPSADQPAVTPSVSTAPPQSRWHWSAIPARLGRARTSTVVLAVLFLAVGALYLTVKPPPTVTVTTGNGTAVVVPANPTTASPTRPTQTTTAPETTTQSGTTTSSGGSSTTGSSGKTTSEPTGRTGPTSVSPSPAPTSPPSLPTTGSAPTS